MKPIRLYESPALKAVTGPTLRPGGFLLTEKAVRFCELPEKAFVLDMGCGPGASMERLGNRFGLRVFGLDASLSLLREGRKRRPPFPLAAGRAGRSPFRDGSFDAVICECVLSLLEEPGLALLEFERVLKTEGRVILTDLYARRPEGLSALRRLPLQSCLQGARTKGNILALVAAAGLETVLWEDHTVLLKRLAAKLVFEYGSMKDFWSTAAPQCPPDELAEAQARAMPGYYLLVARKRS